MIWQERDQYKRVSAYLSVILMVSACNPAPPQLPVSYTGLSDDDIMILFTKSMGSMESDYSNPPPGIESLEREVTRRKLATLPDMEKIFMAGKYADQGEAYVGMRSNVLVALRGRPYKKTIATNSERWAWGDGIVTSPNRYRTRDYVCVRNSLIVGVRYTYCDFGDCSSNKVRGEDC